jgi:predicted Zn-dependent protease
MKHVLADSQCIHIAMVYIHHLCVQAERLDRTEAAPLLAEAWKTCGTLDRLVPLADKRMHNLLAAWRLDVARLMRNEEAMLEQAQKLNTDYHVQLVHNLRNNSGKKIWICNHTPQWQIHNTCLPSSVGTLHPKVNVEKLAEELTYGGTNIVRCLDWLERNSSLTGIPFIADAQIVRQLLQKGIGFIYLTGGDDWAHAMAAIGLDDITEEIIIHDPSSDRAIRLPLSELKRNVGPFGPQCVALVEKQHIEFAKELIPPSQREPFEAFLTFQNDVFHTGKNDGSSLCEELLEQYPDHPLSQRIQALDLMRKNRIEDAISQLENLLKASPQNLYLRMDLLEAFHRCQNSIRQLNVYGELLTHARIKDIPAATKTRNPVFIARYADYLGINDKDIPHAQLLLELGLRRFPGSAELWHVLADIYWRQSDFEAALLPMRMSACLAAENDHYARGVLDVCALLNRPDEGFEFLQRRAETAGRAEGAGAAWATWIAALSDHGLPQRAEEILTTALQKLPKDGHLISFAIRFYALQGHFEKADLLIPSLKQLDNQRMALHAEADYLEACGDWKGALSLIEQLHAKDPGNDTLARQYLYLLRGRDGIEVALEKARAYGVEFPDHEGYEVLFYDYLQAFGLSEEREKHIRRRLSRNPKEIQGWIELANSLLNQVEQADGPLQNHLLEEIQSICTTVKELALSDQRVLLVDARVALCSGMIDRAEALCLEAIGLDANNPEPIHALLNLYQRQPVQQRTKKLLHLADMLHAKGSRADAIETVILQLAEVQGTPKTEELLKAWRTARPEEPIVAKAEVRLLTECARDRHDFEKAAKLLDDIIVRFPGTARFHYMRIQVLARLNTVDIEQDLEQYIARFPRHIDARNQLAQLKLRKNQLQEALAILEQGIECIPQDRESWRALAQFQDDQLHDVKRAATTLSDALKLMPQDFGLAEYYHHLLCSGGETEAALQHAKAMTERFPDRAYVWHMLATLMSSVGTSIPVKAIEQAYTEALSLHPGQFESADGLADLLASNGRTQEARLILKSLPNQQEHDYKIKGRFAWIQFVEGDSKGAIDSMFEILEKHTDYQWGWMQMLYWIENDGHLELARKCLRKVPESLMHHTDWRVRRIQVLENCGEKDESLHKEWGTLTHDFPTDSRVMLTYVDRCLERNEIATARAVLERYAASDPHAPYVQARFVQVCIKENKRAEAVEQAFQIWCRSGNTIEWPDHIAWITLVPPGEGTLPAALAKRFREILQRGDQIRPPIVERACSLQSKLKYGSLIRMAQKHPERAEMLAAVFSGMIEQNQNKEALRQWQKLDAIDTQAKALQQCGLRLLLGTGPDKKSRAEIQRIMKNWDALPDVEMWTVSIYLFVLETEVDLFKDRKKTLSVTDQLKLEQLEQHCANCIATLQFDSGTQYILSVWCRVLLAQGNLEKFHEVYQQFEKVLNNTDSDAWCPPLNKPFLSSLPRLRTLLLNQPIDLEIICAFGKTESKRNIYPVYMFRCLVQALRQRQNTIHRNAKFAPAVSAGKGTATQSSFPWWSLLIVYVLIRGCASMIAP